MRLAPFVFAAVILLGSIVAGLLVIRSRDRLATINYNAQESFPDWLMWIRPSRRFFQRMWLVGGIA